MDTKNANRATTVQKPCKWRIKRKSHEESYDSSWDFGALEGTRIPGPLIKRIQCASFVEFQKSEETQVSSHYRKTRLSALLITDWSGIAYEYAFTTLRPVLYINTPMKIMNPEYEKIGVVPINIFMRDSIGCSLNLDQLDRVADEATRLIEQRDLYHDKIDAFVKQYVYHLGTSAKVGANYIKLRLKQIHSEE